MLSAVCASKIRSPGRWLLAALSATASLALASCSGRDAPSSPLTQGGQASIAITVTGLPANTNAGVTVTGPFGFSQSLTASATLRNLPPGTYTVAATAVNTPTVRYAPSRSSQIVILGNSPETQSVPIQYGIATGILELDVVKPADVPASVTVSGNGFSRVLTGPSTLTHLAPGSYSVAASVVRAGGSAYAPDPAVQNVTVPASAVAVPARVTYAEAPDGGVVNLTIDGVHVTQSVQTYDGAVPLVAGRSGLLRVFVRASAPNVEQPGVRVRFYQGGSLVTTIDIAAPTPAVPVSIAEATLSASWNHALPASLLQPGMSLVAEVDPSNGIPETSESDNRWPASGTPAPLDVRAVPPLDIRFVPVLQSANGLVGDISDANRNAFLAPTRNMFPLAQVSADIRATYTTSAPPVQSNNGNGAWSQILNEIRALRAADGSTRTYYGVVKATYSSGVAGVAFLGTGAGIGWDAPTSGPGVMAHELGHTFGRNHSPCGLSGTNPDYPYAGGAIGVTGYDLANGKMWPSSTPDLMGYCSSSWISDYTYAGVLAWRQQNAFATAASVGGNDLAALPPATREPGLLVWGRMRGDDLVLEPAYEIDAPPSLPARPGSDILEGFGAAGERRFTLAFDAEPVPDLEGERMFAFVIPMRMLGAAAFGGASLGAAPPGGALGSATLARLRLVSRGREVERTTRLDAAGAAATALTAARLDARTLRVTWPADAVRGVLIRDARTGDILAFGRDGHADVRDTGSELELLLSDGVRTLKRRLPPR